MFAWTDLAAYVAVVALLFLIPGPAVLLTLARSISGGPRAGIATGFGIAAGDAVHTLMAVIGLSAILIAFYTYSVSPSSHGNFYELYAIAAAVLGGCSLRGGEGSILGIVLGTILLQVLQNLVNLLGIPSSLNFAVMGTVILLGVLADQQLQKRRALKVAERARQHHEWEHRLGRRHQAHDL